MHYSSTVYCKKYRQDRHQSLSTNSAIILSYLCHGGRIVILAKIWRIFLASWKQFTVEIVAELNTILHKIGKKQTNCRN